MKDSVLQSTMSFFLPPADAARVSAFLTAATQALGGRSDAHLARTIGVPAHVIANWRRRQRVPEEYGRWFGSTLAEKIGSYNVDLPAVSLEARAAVVGLMALTGCDPIAASKDYETATAMSLGGLLALAQFMIDMSGEKQANVIAEWMMPVMRSFRHADQLRAFL